MGGDQVVDSGSSYDGLKLIYHFQLTQSELRGTSVPTIAYHETS
jgi:hypothetical protein